MSSPVFKRAGPTLACALAAATGVLSLPGCGDPAQGTVQVAPQSRHLGTDPVTKLRRGVDPSKVDARANRDRAGTLPRGRGRAIP
jgi:hypothetical protein